MWPLCVLCILLSPVQGQDPGISDWREIFARPFSDVLLPLRYNRTIDKNDRTRCDRFTWTYRGISPSVRISRSKRCEMREYNFTKFSNYNTSLDGNLTLINVTRNISGNYTVIVENPKGDEVFTDYYTLHVQEPVSEPLLNVLCLLDGRADIFCGTDTGDDLTFSIMVNEASLLETSPSSRTVGGIRGVNVTVASPGPWDITCSVKNRVSNRETRITKGKCPVPPSGPVLEVLCLHNGSLEISCSVENGTDPIFSLSVNETLLVKNITVEQKRVNVTSPSPGPWNVHCSVRNGLGERNENKTYKACPVPPSDPVLNVSCPHNGSLEISCSVEKGTDPIFSLSVNGELLLDNETMEQKRVNVISPSTGPWEVHCSVRNILGEKSNTMTYKACPVPVSVPVINGSCQHDGSARVICEVEKGSNATYNWTINGKLIHWNTVPNLIIDASEYSSGPVNISCSAENSISREHSNDTQMYCEVPVSGPIINSSCQHDGSARVVCEVEKGSNVTYNWTINGKQIHWNIVPNLIINASDFTSGPINISCSAVNSISQEHSNNTEIHCGESSSCSDCLKKSVIGGVVALIVTTSPFLIALYYIGRNTREER